MFLGKNYAPHISIYIVQSFTLNHMIQKTAFIQIGAKICTYTDIHKLFYTFLKKRAIKTQNYFILLSIRKKRYKAQKTPKIRGKEI